MEYLTVGRHTLQWGERTYIMGILNITPDSFSGDGLMASPTSNNSAETESVARSLERARQFAADGADILDIGGESTRPGSQPISADEEISRILPVIQAVTAALPDVLISVDTYKAAVAEAALQAGAHMVNDVWALRADPELAKVAAVHGAPVVLMHNRSNPSNVEVRERLGSAYQGAEYQNLIEDVKSELTESIQTARSAGIADTHIIIDPGIGFGKTVQHNLELIDRLGELRGLGFPVLLGPSRKSFIGYVLNLPPDQRLEGTAAAGAVGILRGADILRVHDVTYMVRVARMVDAIVRRK